MTDTIRRWECPRCGRVLERVWSPGDSHGHCPGVPVERVYVARDALPERMGPGRDPLKLTYWLGWDDCVAAIDAVTEENA